MPDVKSGCVLPKILLTGAPGCGKTTLLETVVSKLRIPAGGFLTREVRRNGVRLGFEIGLLNGDSRLLAHVDFAGSPRVSRFGIDLQALSEMAVPALEQAMARNVLVVVDEIGPMEMCSEPFRQVIWKALTGNYRLFGTIVKRSLPETDQLKHLPGVQVIEVNKNNRQQLVQTIQHQLRIEETDHDR